MTDEQIQQIAFANGFQLKPQAPDGHLALNPYVFEFARALLAAAPTHIPDGWKLVLIEPTQWMRVQGGEGFEDKSIAEIWRRMLKACPAPGVESAGSGRIPIDEALEIVESYGPYGNDINEDLRMQIVLAEEVKRLRGLYESAVKGRAAFRSAYRLILEPPDDDPNGEKQYRSLREFLGMPK